MPIAKRVIRVLVGCGRLTVADFHNFAVYVYQKIVGNPAFPKPPVDLSLLKAATDRLASLIAAATYGDSRVVIERDQVRRDIHIMLRRLAHYVEDEGPDDRAAAESSGFHLMPSSVAARSILPPRITRIDHRQTGQLHVRYTTVGRDARKSNETANHVDHCSVCPEHCFCMRRRNTEATGTTANRDGI
jgi:hypothetical protein